MRIINIAKNYDDKSFEDDVITLLDDIPSDILEDKADLQSAFYSGLETNFPKAFKHLKGKQALSKVAEKHIDDYAKKYKIKNDGEYMEYFRSKLEEYGVESPADLSESQKSKFFAEVKDRK